MKKNDLVV